MDVDELLAKAWKAVEKAGVPAELQEAAFRAAVDFLRDDGGAPSTSGGGTARKAGARKVKAPQRRPRVGGATDDDPPGAPALDVDEDRFFADLAKESGVDETDLRDILHLTTDGRVQVTTPTKELGNSTAAQAKNVIALVAGARSRGLGERPVSTEAVRSELQRKQCYQGNHFSEKHLGPMKGFNAVGKDEISVTSKWVDEFETAVDKAHGREKKADE